MSLAFRAGISEHDFWGMTAHTVYIAFRASQENLSRLAYRTAIYTRIQPKHLPKTEDDIFKRAKAVKRQGIREQLAMAKLITKVLQ